LVPSVQGLCPLSCKTCNCTKNCPPEEDKNLLCDEKEMRDNLAAFLSACDGARGCGGQCKEAFDAKYAGCVRGYVPFLVDGGFKNATLKRILDQCAPNDRATPITFHIDLLTDTAELYGPIAVAAVNFAIGVMKDDPQLFNGFAPQVQYDLFHLCMTCGEKKGREDGVDGFVAILRSGVTDTNVAIGGDQQDALMTASRMFAKFDVVNIYANTGVSIASPLNKPLFPYSVGSLASGIKILSIFGPILVKFGNYDMRAHLLTPACRFHPPSAATLPFVRPSHVGRGRRGGRGACLSRR
jgi:hypothetical protein